MGVDRDTAAFAVESIRRWRSSLGEAVYPRATRLPIAGARTAAGLAVHSELDTGSDPAGVKVSDREVAGIELRRDRIHGAWSYSLHPGRRAYFACIILLRALGAWRRDWMGTPAGSDPMAGRVAIGAIALIPLLFGTSLARVFEPAAFGAFHDDTLSVSSAKSLAEDGEYRFTSFPGVDIQPKYPPLHPLALAALWRLCPDLPENLTAIYAVGVVSGLAFLLGCFRWLSRREIGPSKILVLSALCVSWWPVKGRRPLLPPIAIPIAAAAWWTYYAAAQAAPVPAGAAPGYAQSLVVYQSYGGFWVESVPSVAVFVRMTVTNFFALFREAAFLSFQLPKGEVSARWIFLLETILTGWMFIGAMRRYGRAGATVLDWAMMIRSAAGAADGAVRALGRFYFVAIGCLLTVSAYSYLWLTPAFYAAAMGARADNGAARNELFEWFRSSTSPDETFVATEDVLIYLHTGRRGVRPIALTTDALYEGGSEALERQLPYLPHTANAIGASYWVWTAEDYGMEPAKPRGTLVEETDRMLAGREVVFESADGRSRVYRWRGQ